MLSKSLIRLLLNPDRLPDRIATNPEDHVRLCIELEGACDKAPINYRPSAASRLVAMVQKLDDLRLRDAQVVIESWRRHYNMVRPHGAIGYRPPVPKVFVPAFAT